MTDPIFLDDRECFERCKSVEHGEIICAALTKREVSDIQLCTYLEHICCCCENVKDKFGHTALHIAASCGRLDVVKWLISTKHANINIKDLESGYTALHRSVFYGKINVAVYLIKQGANLTLTDNNGLTVFDHIIQDNVNPTGYSHINEGEVYVWGTNTNYTLGPQQARVLPELLDAFHREYPNTLVQQVCLDTFHCILVTTDGAVFACGHGQGGRLGFASEDTVISPKQIQFVNNRESAVCIKASIALNHSVFLMDSGRIWICGLNTHRVLGLDPPPEHLLMPHALPSLIFPVTDICAGKYHTVAWGPRAVYSWGLHAGQLGHEKTNDKYVITPKIMSWITNQCIVAVATCIGATVIVTETGNVYVLHEYKNHKIATKITNIRSVTIVGGKLNEKLDNCLTSEKHQEITVIVLNNFGNIYLWQETQQQFVRCVFSINRSLIVKQIILNINEVLFTTCNGEAFQGTLKPRKKTHTKNNSNSLKHSHNKFLDVHDCQLIKVSKIPHIHRAISIHSDLKGQNYAVLQASPAKFLTVLQDTSHSLMQDHMYLLLKEASENDYVHDVIFKIGNHFFPAHRYIIASSSNKLYDLIATSNDATVDILNVNVDIFEQLLLFLYTGTCDFLKNSKCSRKIQLLCSKEGSNKQVISENIKDPIRLLQETARKFGVKSLQNLLNCFYYKNGYIISKDSTILNVKPKFNLSDFPELYDVTLKSKDKKQLLAHKCILVARLEYFNNLFSTRWNQDSSKEIYLPYPYNIIEQVIEFLYTDELPLLYDQDIEHICQLLIISEQFFISRLKETCECTLSTFVTLKNVAEMLSFASVYNASRLKLYCIQYICINMAALLEVRSLEALDQDLLCEITDFYYNFNPSMQYRMITPYSYAPSDEVIIAISSVHEISLVDNSTDCAISTKAHSKSLKRRSRTRKSSSTDCCNRKESEIETKADIIITECSEEVNKNDLNLSKTESRLKAIINAREKINSDSTSIEYTKLPLKQDVDMSLSSFPELNASQSSKSHLKSPNKLDVKQKLTKLSQKQRKRLSSENSSELHSPTIEEIKNPWKICTTIDGEDEFKEPDPVPMNSIIIDEKKQKEKFVKMKTKLLVYTQVEDKAIEDLYKFYNVENIFDEVITVNRVQLGAVASPVWVPSNKVK